MLYSFCTAADCTDGSLPEAGLAYAGQGAGKPYDGTSPLFGTTNAGGASRFGGTAYELSPGNNGWNEQVLHDFCGDASCSDGSNLEAPLTVGPHGNLFGITFQGGNTGFGTAFELAPSGDSWSETILHVFCQKANCADGEFPASGVAIDGNGGVVGITDEGGVNCVDRDHTGGCGVIWRIATKGGAPRYSVIHAMGQNGNADGADPATAPLLDKKGNIYGVTYFGGANLGGVLFELTGKKLKVLYSFCALSACADGVQPNGLVRGQTGGLFGTTAFGGTGSDPSGTVFALTR